MSVYISHPYSSTRCIFNYRLGQVNNFGFMPYGQQWRRYRRHFWQHFTSRAVGEYQSVQRATALQFLVQVLERPSQVRDHIRW